MYIKEIYRLNYMRNYWSYVGTLRNEKKFNLHDKVFFVVNKNEIAKGKIVGVELPPIDNAEYQYKIKLPEELVRLRMNDDDFYKGENIDKVTLICDSIFNTIEEAKESAIKQLDKLYKLQKEEIDRYFKQWEE
jgi:hypothetical protein